MLLLLFLLLLFFFYSAIAIMDNSGTGLLSSI